MLYIIFRNDEEVEVEIELTGDEDDIEPCAVCTTTGLVYTLSEGEQERAFLYTSDRLRILDEERDAESQFSA